MLQKFGVAGLLLSAGLLFVNPSVASAQDWYGRGGDSFHDDRRHRDHRDYDRERQREEQQARKWREKELRARQRWERRNLRDYQDSYRGDRYPTDGHRDQYRPY